MTTSLTEPTTTGVDVAALRAALDYVTDHPHRWRQSTWLHRTWCGTTGCLAGNVVLNAGYRPYWDRYDRARSVTSFVEVDPTGPDRRYALHDVRTGAWFADVGDVARRLLGLTGPEAACLFAPFNTLDDLWSLAGRLTDGRVRREGTRELTVAS